MGADDGTSCRFGPAKRELDKRTLTCKVLLALVSSIVLCWSFWDLREYVDVAKDINDEII